MNFLFTFKKPLLVSLISHLTLFSFFSFTYGNRIPPANYAAVSFWGQVLYPSQVSQPASAQALKGSFTHKPATAVLDKIVKIEILPAVEAYSKPPVVFAFSPEKEIFSETIKTPLSTFRKREPVIILHPVLPYGFTLYFKDRQVAHVELAFKIEASAERNTLSIKRKISSGNLEVDLLTMRYIDHYLFIQGANYPVNNWQAVKVDLSAKND